MRHMHTVHDLVILSLSIVGNRFFFACDWSFSAYIFVCMETFCIKTATIQDMDLTRGSLCLAQLSLIKNELTWLFKFIQFPQVQSLIFQT